MAFKTFNQFQQNSDSMPTRFRPLLQFCKIGLYQADDTITIGQAVKYDIVEIDTVFPTDGEVDGTVLDGYASDIVSLLPKVIPTSVATGDPGFVGIALHGASAGEDLWVVTEGFCPKILISSDDVNDGEALVCVASGASETYVSTTHTTAVNYGIAVSTETDNGGFVSGIIDPNVS